MGLKINQTLHTPDGGTVNTGSIVKFFAYFPEDSLNLECGLSLYRSQDDYDAGKQKIKTVDEFSMKFEKTFTEAEYGALTPVIIHDELKAWLMDQLGTTDDTKVDIEL
jgi:hypothetical protein